MATKEQIEGWEAWKAERPTRVREVAQRFNPWSLYRLTNNGHRVTIYSTDEPEDENDPVTLKVRVLHQYNEGLAFERTVFGVKPEDLEFSEVLS